MQVAIRAETKWMEMAKSTYCGKCGMVLGVWWERMIVCGLDMSLDGNCW